MKRTGRGAVMGTGACCAITMMIAACPTARAQVIFNTVRLSGDVAIPGNPFTPDVLFESFVPPAVFGGGELVFSADLQGATVTTDNDQSLWGAPAGVHQLIAREGNPANPPGGFAHFEAIHSFGMNVNRLGDVVFRGEMFGVAAGTETGIWQGDPDGLRLVAREGSAAPGLPPADTYESFIAEDVAINAMSEVAFVARAGGVDGLWSEGGSGTLELLARDGTPAPGLPAGVTYSSVFFGGPRLNDSGQTAFYNRLTGAGITTANDGSVWIGQAGSLRMVARDGDPAPDAGVGVFFDAIDVPRLDSSGEVMFLAELTGSGVTAANNRSLWTETAPGVLDLIARQGDPAPGAGPGAVFSLITQPLASGAGHVAFQSSMTGPGINPTNDTGLFRATNGSIQPIALEGTPAPGLPGVSFGFIPSFFNINASGYLVFNSLLTGAGISGPNENALWAAGADGQPFLVLRDGDVIDVNNDPGIVDQRTVLNFFRIEGNGQDGRSTSLRDDQLGLRIMFTDGTSGVFTVTLVFPLPGDADGDGDVDLDDFNILASNFGLGPGAPGGSSIADFNGDGHVNLDDFNLLASNFGTGTEAVTPLPEPATLLLLTTGVGCLLGRRGNLG